jgi:hypothetical protein
MSSQEEIFEQKQLLDANRRTLHILLHQKATHTSAFTPPAVEAGIREARKDIRAIKRILRDWGAPVTDHPNDEESNEVEEPAQKRPVQTVQAPQGKRQEQVARPIRRYIPPPPQARRGSFFGWPELTSGRKLLLVFALIGLTYLILTTRSSWNPRSPLANSRFKVMPGQVLHGGDTWKSPDGWEVILISYTFTDKAISLTWKITNGVPRDVTIPGDAYRGIGGQPIGGIDPVVSMACPSADCSGDTTLGSGQSMQYSHTLEYPDLSGVNSVIISTGFTTEAYWVVTR